MPEPPKNYLIALAALGGLGLILWLAGREGSSGHSSSFSSSPSPQVVWPDSAIIARKREEWTAKGYPPGLQDRAVDWAKGWSAGIARRVGLPEEAPKIYPQALDLSERWMRGLWGLFR